MLAARALAETATPVRPFEPGVRPAWNRRAVQFLYAPAFDLPKVTGAVRYRFTLKDATGRIHACEADAPWRSLQPVWTSVPAGPAELVVEGLDAAGVAVPPAVRRTFHRASPFVPLGEEPSFARRSADRALSALVASPDLRCWFEGPSPDPNFPMYRYPAKIIGAAAAALARSALTAGDRTKAEEARGAARRAADHMLGLAFGEQSAWAHHPPTYHPTMYAERLKGHMSADRYMTNCGADAGRSLLEVHAATGDVRYLDAAVRIAETYRRNQLPDGSWWLFVNPTDGKPAAPNVLIPTAVINFLDELEAAAGDRGFSPMRDRALAWTLSNPVKTWDWQGQFEDVRPVPPYENLTKHEACDLAIHLFNLKRPSAEQSALASELLRFAEDQFVVWGSPPAATPVRQGADGSSAKARRWNTPCVLEQYRCYAPVSASSAKLIRTFLAAWRATGDRMHLEKARALGAALVRAQEHVKAPGRYQTWLMTPPGAMWFNCELSAERAMRELGEAG
ncbi:MAG: hypothetical protein RL105_1448 [Verrucomicrobiota bacterium]|jgi:maltose/maltodextrin transport system substrate-binding protein